MYKEKLLFKNLCPSWFLMGLGLKPKLLSTYKYELNFFHKNHNGPKAERKYSSQGCYFCNNINKYSSTHFLKSNYSCSYWFNNKSISSPSGTHSSSITGCGVNDSIIKFDSKYNPYKIKPDFYPISNFLALQVSDELPPLFRHYLRQPVRWAQAHKTARALALGKNKNEGQSSGYLRTSVFVLFLEGAKPRLRLTPLGSVFEGQQLMSFLPSAMAYKGHCRGLNAVKVRYHGFPWVAFGPGPKGLKYNTSLSFAAYPYGYAYNKGKNIKQQKNTLAHGLPPVSPLWGEIKGRLRSYYKVYSLLNIKTKPASSSPCFLFLQKISLNKKSPSIRLGLKTKKEGPKGQGDNYAVKRTQKPFFYPFGNKSTNNSHQRLGFFLFMSNKSFLSYWLIPVAGLALITTKDDKIRKLSNIGADYALRQAPYTKQSLKDIKDKFAPKPTLCLNISYIITKPMVDCSRSVITKKNFDFVNEGNKVQPTFTTANFGTDALNKASIRQHPGWICLLGLTPKLFHFVLRPAPPSGMLEEVKNRGQILLKLIKNQNNLYFTPVSFDKEPRSTYSIRLHPYTGMLEKLSTSVDFSRSPFGPGKYYTSGTINPLDSKTFINNALNFILTENALKLLNFKIIKLSNNNTLSSPMGNDINFKIIRPRSPFGPPVTWLDAPFSSSKSSGLFNKYVLNSKGKGQSLSPLAPGPKKAISQSLHLFYSSSSLDKTTSFLKGYFSIPSRGCFNINFSSIIRQTEGKILKEKSKSNNNTKALALSKYAGNISGISENVLKSFLCRSLIKQPGPKAKKRGVKSLAKNYLIKTSIDSSYGFQSKHRLAQIFTTKSPLRTQARGQGEHLGLKPSLKYMVTTNIWLGKPYKNNISMLEDVKGTRENKLSPLKKARWAPGPWPGGPSKKSLNVLSILFKHQKMFNNRKLKTSKKRANNIFKARAKALALYLQKKRKAEKQRLETAKALALDLQKKPKTKQQRLEIAKALALDLQKKRKAEKQRLETAKALALDLQKKRKAKKQRLETRRQKKRTRFFPRPMWLRYRMFFNFIKQTSAKVNLGVKIIKREHPFLDFQNNLNIRKGQILNLRDIKIKAKYINFKNQKTNNPPPKPEKDNDNYTLCRDFWVYLFSTTNNDLTKKNLLWLLPNNTSSPIFPFQQDGFYPLSSLGVKKYYTSFFNFKNPQIVKNHLGLRLLKKAKAKKNFYNYKNMVRQKTYNIKLYKAFGRGSNKLIQKNNTKAPALSLHAEPLSKDAVLWFLMNLWPLPKLHTHPSPMGNGMLENHDGKTKKRANNIKQKKVHNSKQIKTALAQNRIYWALKKTNTNSFTDYNKRYNLWGSQKLRNQSKNNKTKYLEKQFIKYYLNFFVDVPLPLVFTFGENGLDQRQFYNGYKINKKITSKRRQKKQKLNYLTSFTISLKKQKIFKKTFQKNIKFFNTAWWLNSFIKHKKLNKINKKITSKIRQKKQKLNYLTSFTISLKKQKIFKKTFQKNIKFFNTAWWLNSFIKTNFNKSKLIYTPSKVYINLSNINFDKFLKGQGNNIKLRLRPIPYGEGPLFKRATSVRWAQAHKTARALALGKNKSEEQSSGLILSSSILLHFCALISLVSISRVRCFVKFHVILLYKLSNIYNTILLTVSHQIKKKQKLNLNHLNLNLKHLTRLRFPSSIPAGDSGRGDKPWAYYMGTRKKQIKQPGPKARIKKTSNIIFENYKTSLDKNRMNKSIISFVHSIFTGGKRWKQRIQRTSFSFYPSPGDEQTPFLFTYLFLGLLNKKFKPNPKNPKKKTNAKEDLINSPYYLQNILKIKTRGLAFALGTYPQRMQRTALSKAHALALDKAFDPLLALIKNKGKNHDTVSKDHGRLPYKNLIYSKLNIISLKAFFLNKNSIEVRYNYLDHGLKLKKGDNLDSKKSLPLWFSSIPGWVCSFGKGQRWVKYYTNISYKKNNYDKKGLNKNHDAGYYDFPGLLVVFERKYKKDQIIWSFISLSNILVVSLKKARLKVLRDLIDIFQISVRTISSFFEKPAEFTSNFIAYGFLVEWSSDLQTIIPENVDIYVWNICSKFSRVLPLTAVLTTKANSLVPFLNLNNTSVFYANNFEIIFLNNKFDFFVKTKKYVGGGLPVLFLISHLLNRRMLYLFDTFLETLSQPDADLIRRQEKGKRFWDIWADFLITAADYYTVNVAALSTIKAEQNTLIDNISNNNNNSSFVFDGFKNYIDFFSIFISIFSKSTYEYDMSCRSPFGPGPKAGPKANSKGKGQRKLDITTNIWLGLIKDNKLIKKKYFRWSLVNILLYFIKKNVSPYFYKYMQNYVLVRSNYLPLVKIRAKKNNYNDQSQQDLPNIILTPVSFDKSFSEKYPSIPYGEWYAGKKQKKQTGPKAKSDQRTTINKINYSGINSNRGATQHVDFVNFIYQKAVLQRLLKNVDNVKVIKNFNVNQSITYQSWPNGDLFMDYHPAKSFSHIPVIKYNSVLQQPIGTLVCQIYSGIFNKQISKNVLLVNTKTTMKQKTNYNVLLLQALAGETELKIITDNAQRYERINRGFAIGIKLLRDVFDAIALNTPCIFLLEDIHKIGERRPMLISDYGGAMSDDNGSFKEDFFGSQRDEVHEKNQVVYQLTRHKITHYKKPFKGDYSFIPTNLYVTDLFLKVPTQSTSNLSLVLNHNLTIKNKIKNLKLNFLKSKLYLQNSSPRGNDDVSKKKSHFQFVLKTSCSNPASKDKARALVKIKIGAKRGSAFKPPSTSPFAVFLLKEGKKFKPNKIVEELPWTGLPGEQLLTKTRTSYSVRAKVAMLAEFSLSNLSAKLDMITDLLVIIDSVRSNKGFVVFATTNLPHILDPALRRPGRLDETICLPDISTSNVLNFFTNYEIIKTVKPYTLSALNNLNNTLKGQQTLLLFKPFSFPFNGYNLLTVNLKDYNKTINKLNPENLGHIFSLNYARIAHPKKLKNKQLVIPFMDNNSSLPLPSALIPRGCSERPYLKPMPYLQMLDGKKKTKKAKGYKERQYLLIRKKEQENYTGMLEKLYPSGKGKDKDKAIAYYEVGKILLNYYLNNLHSIKKAQYLAEGSDLIFKSINYLSLYGSKNKLLLQLMLIFGGKISQLISSRKKASFYKKYYSLNNFVIDNILAFGPGPKGLRLKTRVHAQVLLDNPCLFLQDKNFQLLTDLMLSFIQKRYLYRKNLIVPKLLSFADGNILEEPPSPPFSNLLIPAKRFENYKRVFHDSISGNKMGQRNAQISLTEKLQSHTRLRSILLLNNKNKINNNTKGDKLWPFPKLHTHPGMLEEKSNINFDAGSKILLTGPKKTKLRSNIYTDKKSQDLPIKISQGLLLNQKLKLEQNFNELSPFFSSTYEYDMSYNSSSLVKAQRDDDGFSPSNISSTTNINWYYQNRILKRHGQYLTNQWWNGQLSEHNAETVFLSDIDWRASFIKNKQKNNYIKSKKIKNFLSISLKKSWDNLDVLLDFPDTDQYYNPRRRRWLLNKGYWSFWFNFDKVYSEEMISTWILESIIQTYSYLHNNTELLDFVASKFIALGYNTAKLPRAKALAVHGWPTHVTGKKGEYLRKYNISKAQKASPDGDAGSLFGPPASNENHDGPKALSNSNFNKAWASAQESKILLNSVKEIFLTNSFKRF